MNCCQLSAMTIIEFKKDSYSKMAYACVKEILDLKNLCSMRLGDKDLSKL